MADPNISEEVYFEMLEKKADGSFKAKYPKVKSKSGITFDEHLADYIHHAGYGTASGTNAKTITLDPVPSGYKEGMTVAFKNITQNTGAVTIDVNGLGAKSILKSNGNALSSGNLKAGSIYTIRYNGTNFILQGEVGESEIVKGELSWSASKNVEKTVYLGFRPKYVFVIITLGAKTQPPAIIGHIIDGAISRVPGDNYSGEVYKLLTTSTGFSITPLVGGGIDMYCSYIAIK